MTAAATATALVSSVNPTAAGQATTFTATVSSAAGTPAGAVTFTDGAVPLWTGALSGGTVNFSIFTLAGGSHSLTATYSGSPDHQASTSPAVGQTVQEADTVARAVPSAAQACPGESVSFTVSVPPPASPMVPQPLLLVPPVADEAEEAESSGDEIAPTSSGDLNGDGAVDYRDYLCLCGWLAANDTRPLPAEADRNGDGRIDTRDLVLLGQEVNQLPRIVRYTVNPPLIAPGEEAVLSWEIEGADSARIEPEVGEVNSDGGTAAVRPSATTFYKLSAVNHMGTSRNSIRVRVGRTPTLTGQPASQTVPDEFCQDFAGGIFQAGNVVEHAVVELLDDRLDQPLDLPEIHHPAGLRIDRACNVNVHTVAVPVDRPALMAGRCVGQAVRRLKTERLYQLGLHD